MDYNRFDWTEDDLESVERDIETMPASLTHGLMLKRDAIMRCLDRQGGIGMHNGWHLDGRTLVSPDGTAWDAHDPAALLTAAQIADMRGVTKRRVLQWGERIGLKPLGSLGMVATARDALAFEPEAAGRPKKS